MKITISVEGTNKDSNKKLIDIMDDILFNKGTSIPQGVEVEFRNVRTRNRPKKAVSSNSIPEETTSQENQ